MLKMLRSGLIAFVSIATVLVLLPSAQAVDLKISGQINRAILWADNGHDDEHWFVDNDNSSSRFRFTGSNDFDNNFSVGFVWEVEQQSNSSNKLDIGEDADLGDVTFEERKLEFYVDHTYGRVWLGQGSMASDGTAEVDLSGTDVITYSGIADMAGGVTFRDDNNNILLNPNGTNTQIQTAIRWVGLVSAQLRIESYGFCRCEELRRVRPARPPAL
jgi:hypothetical protein